MEEKINKEISRLNNSLYIFCERLSNSFSTKDRNEVIKITIQIRTLKRLLNE